MTYRLTFEDGSDALLKHHGVKGMHWGVRNAESEARLARESKASFRTNRKAKKDAKEFARAKMYYGKGAGNRRKLIKNQVASRSKNLPGYSEAFEKHLAEQDMGKHVKKAKSERRRNDIVDTTKKTARGATHAYVGNTTYASAGAIALVGAAKLTGADKKIASYVSEGARKVARYAKNKI